MIPTQMKPAMIMVKMVRLEIACACGDMGLNTELLNTLPPSHIDFSRFVRDMRLHSGAATLACGALPCVDSYWGTGIAGVGVS